jgi:hypothetical protein
VANRTQIICLHEGERGRSIDPLFIRTLLKALDPKWIRPWTGSLIRTVDCGGRNTLINRMSAELRLCLAMGGNTTLMVWADLDHDMANGEELKAKFWSVAQEAGISKQEFDQVVFVFAKDRIENWIQFLLTGQTDESQEAPRLKHGHPVAEAARKLAIRCCKPDVAEPPLCPSLAWSCRNWRALKLRLKD